MNYRKGGEKKLKKLKIRGFTLVELLVVIAILGILAGVLLVGINPLEQVNKAKDSGKLAKCKEAIGGAERYYAFRETEPTCALLESSDELKTGSCTGVTLAGSAGTYTCQFTSVSKAFLAKCVTAVCDVPADFD